MNLIYLTSTQTGTQVLFNTAMFEMAIESEDKTTINLTNGNFLLVKETLAAIEHRIKDAS